MKSFIPPGQTINRNDEASLQRTFEAMLAEIKLMELGEDDKQKLINMLMQYRTAWNSYMNRIKPRKSKK